nr:ANTAR domain-containing protein [Kineosporia rhizophila]
MDAPARVLADQVGAYAAVALTNASLYTGAVAEAEHLRAAMAARAVIEQAKGIIMAGRGCTAEEAFEVLRTESTHTNRKLRDIAQDLVTSVLRPR